jgi:cyclophilin family peptidyl-prolyl cis-trans isomerase
LCLAVALVVLAGVRHDGLAQETPCWPTDPTMTAGYAQWAAPPQTVIDPAQTYSAQIETNMGTITIALDAAVAPNTVNNFVCLAQAGYYDMTIFHRVIEGFMIQGGDPTGTGRGGPGYQFNDELPTTASPYTRGTVAMANGGANTNGSQFFIVQQDQPAEFPSSYSIFGHVTAGLDVVDAIAVLPVGAGPSGEPSSPMKRVGIESITILEGDEAIATPADTGANPTATTAIVPTETPAASESGDGDDDNMALWIAGGAALVVAAGYGIYRGTQRQNTQS